jgi:hypothetical protein
LTVRIEHWPTGIAVAMIVPPGFAVFVSFASSSLGLDPPGQVLAVAVALLALMVRADHLRDRESRPGVSPARPEAAAPEMVAAVRPSRPVARGVALLRLRRAWRVPDGSRV